jgi:hypothetical protein
VQRFGERSDEWSFNGFVGTTDLDAVEALARDDPARWHVEEFFIVDQPRG